MDYQWDFTFVLNSIPWLLTGVLNTLKLSAVALFFGLLIGLIVGIGRTSKTLLVRFPATCYVEFFRNIPGLVQLVWFFYVIPVLTGWQGSAWLSATVSLSLYTGAYCAEIYRAGIESVERGQWEAARALGFRHVGQLRYIVLPIGIRRMLPAFGNRAIELVKATTLASAIAYGELLYTTKLIAEDQLRPLEAYTTATILFTALLLPVSYLMIRLERRGGG